MSVTWITPVEVSHSTDAAWTDNDVSAHISGAATGVILHVFNNTATNYDFGLRKNGSTDNRTPEMDLSTHYWAEIGVDGSGIFESYVEVAANIDVYVVGYHEDDAVFFTNAIDKTAAGADAFEDIDISSDTGGDTAIGAIFEVSIPTNGARRFAFKKKDSTDDFYTNATNTQWVVIGVNGSEICEQKILDLTGTGLTNTFLTGYITKEATFNTNATDLSLGSTGSYIDLSALPVGATGGIFDIHVDGIVLRQAALKEKGAGGDLYNDVNHAWGIVKCDGSRLIEGKVEDITGTGKVNFHLVGYYEAAAGGSAALTGTVTASITESDIVTGGKTIILTLTGDTWVAAGTGPIGSTADTQAIIDGIDSAQSEGTGWDAVVKVGIDIADVVRTSSTVCTITLDAEATYDITAQETITATIPAVALVTSASPIVASPSFTIDIVAAGVTIPPFVFMGNRMI